MNTIAERIKFAMKVKNKKQIEIVRDTGISKGAFSSYLSGQYNPKLDKLQLIADSLDVDVKWLSGENVPMQTATQNTDTVQQYLFYNNSCSEYLIDDTFDTYIGLMNEHSALVPRFLVLVNPSMNEMHLLPIFIKKDSSRFYNCPPALLIPNPDKPEKLFLFSTPCVILKKKGVFICYSLINTLIKFMASLPVMTA